jgi:peptidyl-prolyl cis-trans isomerase A (cyclophilin A)
MKPALVLSLLLVLPLHAELLATFQTSRGNIVVSLQYDKTPQTVANFITLAQGTRPSINPNTGAVRAKRYYVGEKFFRVLDELNGDPDFNIAQTGSGTGTNSGGPGYTFRDEFHPDLKHDPYVLAMANGGPNTNGSQIYFTGNAPIPGLDGRYTVFGLINDTASRAVIDSIIVAGNDNTTINDVTFERNSPAAVAFNEFAQKLPVCSALPGNLNVDPGVEIGYQLQSPHPPGSILSVRRSTNLVTWENPASVYQPTGVAGASYYNFGFDDATAPEAFYNISLVTYPDALTPDIDTLANRTLTFDFGGGTSFTFVFNGTGDGGTMINSQNPEPGEFTLFSYQPFGPYDSQWIMNTSEFGGLRFTCQHNSETDSQISGDFNKAEQFKDPGVWVYVGSGNLTLTK